MITVVNCGNNCCIASGRVVTGREGIKTHNLEGVQFLPGSSFELLNFFLPHPPLSHFCLVGFGE